MRPRNVLTWKPTRTDTGKASVAKEVSDKSTLQFHRGRDDGMYRRNAQEARETDGDSGGNRNGQPARARPGRVGGGEARSSVETG